MIDEPWVLPATWRWSRFDEVARVASNLVDPAQSPNSAHIAPNHIESETGRLLPYATVHEDGVRSPKHRFFPGQILYSKVRPYLAKVVVADVEGLCSADMYPIESELDSRFLKWWMLTREFTRRAAGEQARTVLPKINVRALSALPIPVPPESEQRRIVEVLEDHLSRLDAANAYLHSAGARQARVVDRYLSVALAAVSAPIRPLAEVLRQPLINGHSVPTATDGFPVLRLTALQEGRIDLSARKIGAWTGAEATPFLVRRGDFLVSRGSGSKRLVGRGGLVVAEPDPVAFPDTLIRIRTQPDVVHPKFLALVWNGSDVRRQIEAVAKTTAGIYKINQKDVQNVVVPVPTLDEQDRVAATVVAFQESAERLAIARAEAAARSQALRRSLLSAAFSGRLT